jgi:large conductance mechanosensitive channel
MGMMKEFKDFISKGNVVELAVGVVIGGAFGKIVDSAVNDIIMPPIGYALKGIDFKDLVLKLGDAEIKYGNFIQVSIVFLITAFFLFLVVKAYNRMKKKDEAAPAPTPEPTNEEKLLTEIRDLLKK